MLKMNFKEIKFKEVNTEIFTIFIPYVSLKETVFIMLNY